MYYVRWYTISCVILKSISFFKYILIKFFLKKKNLSINHTQENINYNQETLPKYYGLLLMGCRRSHEYHKKWMEAPNYYWALGSMIFGDFYDDHVSLCIFLCNYKKKKIFLNTFTFFLYRKLTNYSSWWNSALMNHQYLDQKSGKMYSQHWVIMHPCRVKLIKF